MCYSIWLPQVVKVHQNTVDTYLEDMILMSMDMTADSQARREVQVLAEQINDIAYELEDKWVLSVLVKSAGLLLVSSLMVSLNFFFSFYQV